MRRNKNEQEKYEVVETRNYLKEFIVTWIKALLLYGIVYFFMNAFFEGDTYGASLMGAGVALTVFGMTFFNKVIRFNLFGNTEGVWIFWILKLFISLIIGIIAFPIVNLYYIAKIIKSYTNKKIN